MKKIIVMLVALSACADTVKIDDESFTDQEVVIDDSDDCINSKYECSRKTGDSNCLYQNTWGVDVRCHEYQPTEDGWDCGCDTQTIPNGMFCNPNPLPEGEERCVCKCNATDPNDQFRQHLWSRNEVLLGTNYRMWLGMPRMHQQHGQVSRDECWIQFAAMSTRPWTVGSSNFCVRQTSDGEHCLEYVARCIGEMGSSYNPEQRNRTECDEPRRPGAICCGDPGVRC